MGLVRGLIDGSRVVDRPGFRQVTDVYLATEISGNLVCDRNGLLKSLEESGLPKLGELHDGNHPEGIKPRCTYRDARPISSDAAVVDVVFEHRTLFQDRDSSTLGSLMTSILPHQRTPIWIFDERLNEPTRLFRELASIPLRESIRNYTAQITVDYRAAKDISETFDRGVVNKKKWYFRDPGHWLWTGLEAVREDQFFITYGVTFSARGTKRDWSEWSALKDERGKLTKFDDAKIRDLLNLPYKFGVNNDVPGVVKVGLYEDVDFNSVLGLNPGA